MGVFGPSKDEVWRQLCQEIGATFVEGEGWKGNRKALVQAQPTIKLEVKDSEGWFGPRFPDNVDELHFLVVGVIKDVERLKSLFDLFAALLEQLCKIGSAYKQEPGVML